jgi:hypothetical protein
MPPETDCEREYRSLGRGETGALQAETDAAARLRREVLGRIDADVLDGIERRHGASIPVERLRAARESEPTALPREDYEKLLRERCGISGDEAKRVLGHYDSAQDRVYVTPAYPITRQVIAHERLHQLADPRGTSALGRGLDEGITEWLARDAVGSPEFANQPEVWGEARRLAEMLHAQAGEASLKAAYFRGDTAGLEQAVDGACGERAFRSVAQLADAGRYSDAEAILLRGGGSQC